MSNQVAETQSLHGFCKAHGLSKTTVHRYCQAEGIPTANGLSADAIAQIKAHFNVETAQPTPALPAAQSEPASGSFSRLNLPTIRPVQSAIVPGTQTLPTDSRETQTLARTGGQALQRTDADLEQIRLLLQQANAFVDGKINELDSETEESQQQVREIEDLAFQLQTKQEVLRRAEIRNAAARQESEAARVAATGKVVNLSDFFAQRSAADQSGS